MNVPNHEKKAFRDMTPEERSVIVEDFLSENADVLSAYSGMWIQVQNWFSISAQNVYRTRPRQLVIPWENIESEYKWAVMNEDEGLWVYVEKPEIYNEEMWNIRGKCSPLPLNIDTTGIDWRESLTARPDGV